MLAQGYKNGNYTVVMMEDGTKVRYTEEGALLPAFPESIDVKITDRCDGGCPFCYEGCTPAGAHADLMAWQHVVDSLHPYTELALNGNDMTHAQLVWFLKLLHDKRVFANITVSQRHFMQHYAHLKELCLNGWIHGLGVSLSCPTLDLINRLQGIPNAVIHVIAGVVTVDQLKILSNQGLKLLILGYKTIGRGKQYVDDNKYILSSNCSLLCDCIIDIIQAGWFKVVSFDNLALEQLHMKERLTPEQWSTFYMGDDGEFTFYMDLVKGEFARNSMAPADKRYPIGEKTVDEMFQYLKKH